MGGKDIAQFNLLRCFRTFQFPFSSTIIFGFVFNFRRSFAYTFGGVPFLIGWLHSNRRAYLLLISLNLLRRFSKDIKYMTNKPPRFIWKWCWKMISPLAILAVLCMSIKGMSERTPTYGVWDRNTVRFIRFYYSILWSFVEVYLTISIIIADNVTNAGRQQKHRQGRPQQREPITVNP